jgi:hypothetical protein
MRVVTTSVGLSFVQAEPSKSYGVIKQQDGAPEVGRSARCAFRAALISLFLSTWAGSHSTGYDCHSCCDSKCRNRMKPASADVGTCGRAVLHIEHEVSRSVAREQELSVGHGNSVD